ncbi:MAG: hypothetical protein IPN19_15210 [Elusimicrobia bacterium]|nr:hypothetical protein [Elusimicrobiota bacterium]
MTHIGLSKWLTMSENERAAHRRREDEEKARALAAMTAEESLKIGFELMELQRHFPMTCHHAPRGLSKRLEPPS